VIPEALTGFLVRQVQGLLPLVQLIAHRRMAGDDFINVWGGSILEEVMQRSTATVADPPHPGKRGGEVRRHESEAGVICLSTQKVRASKLRLRKRGGDPQAEVLGPVYEAVQSGVAPPGIDGQAQAGDDGAGKEGAVEVLKGIFEIFCWGKNKKNKKIMKMIEK